MLRYRHFVVSNHDNYDSQTNYPSDILFSKTQSHRLTNIYLALIYNVVHLLHSDLLSLLFKLAQYLLIVIIDSFNIFCVDPHNRISYVIFDRADVLPFWYLS